MRHVNKDRLVRDLGAVVADIDELTKAMAENASEAIVAARERIAGSLRTAQDNLQDSRRHVMHQAKRIANSADGYVQDNVWKLMGIAAAVGILAGALLSHRSESPDERRD
jgi:ElaB/YqjD/DUF883 family membrane-anchored ribosome-binding protein